MKPETHSKPNPTRVNWWVDVALFGAILLALAPQFTGLAIHEWLSLALAGGVLIHLLLHWQWIVNVISRFLGRTSWSARINFVLNTVLFSAFVIVSFSGLLISREALPLFGVELQANRTWEMLHRLSADAIVFVVGAHLALHWKWILNALRRYMLNPVFKLGAKPASPPVAIPVEAKQ
jgi:predicted permease